VLDFDALTTAAEAARGCTLCAAALPLGPRPILRVSRTVRLLIISQAPGTRAHETGIPWNDASGDRLRLWLGIDRATFYDESRIGILPMGLCYPGRIANGGDAAPRPECAPLWHPRLLALMQEVRLTLLVGAYAQAAAFGKAKMTDRVRSFRDHLPTERLPLPHPSWRTGVWEKRNPWFAEDILPLLRAQVSKTLGTQSISDSRIAMFSSEKPK
jgi:uracil-DNA glycosylase